MTRGFRSGYYTFEQGDHFTPRGEWKHSCFFWRPLRAPWENTCEEAVKMVPMRHRTGAVTFLCFFVNAESIADLRGCARKRLTFFSFFKHVGSTKNKNKVASNSWGGKMMLVPDWFRLYFYLISCGFNDHMGSNCNVTNVNGMFWSLHTHTSSCFHPQKEYSFSFLLNKGRVSCKVTKD